MKHFALMLAILALAGCTTTSSGFLYMGLADDATRKIEQENPDIDHRLHGLTTVTKVTSVDFQEYLKLKQNKKVSDEERHGGYLYFAVRKMQHCPFGPSPMSGAYIDIVERYKTIEPKGE